MAQRGSIGFYGNSSFNLSSRERWVVNGTHRLLYPWKETRYLLYRRLQGLNERVRKIFHRLRQWFPKCGPFEGDPWMSISIIATLKCTNILIKIIMVC